jgi:hypothetical protein
MNDNPKFGYEQWNFIEIEGEIRDIKNQLIDKFAEIQQLILRTILLTSTKWSRLKNEKAEN